ncbi:sugar transferase [Mangrovimonas sp. YM274]|uniref:sugar transferase n=1 Tax=Mangrovimonas sp. YM274 TaxID=3070660 RepID=UPI0027DCF832|nr:sugar transferase [Mangrovimonas sp. YM274]WMI67266.1 sugar transferase [Mangrovimonas sp. YM274]
MYKSFFKRMLDLIIAITGAVIALPVIVVITVLLWFVNKGKPFYYQKRPGKNEHIFTIIKFKTMTDDKDDYGNLFPESQRLTSIGKFLRKTSLDELPQLWNIIKGEMSLIGPRPLLPRYLPRYNDKQKHRHDIRPGLTGWAQVNGRNTLSWEQKFEYDLWYVENVSLLLDVKILYLSFKKVLQKEGVYSVENDITPEFMGTQNSLFFDQ